MKCMTIVLAALCSCESVAMYQDYDTSITAVFKANHGLRTLAVRQDVIDLNKASERASERASD